MTTPEEIIGEVRGLTNEFRSFRADVFEPYCERNDKALGDILHQATKTNQRVTTLELWKARIGGWGDVIKAQWAAIAILAGVVGGLVGKFIS